MSANFSPEADVFITRGVEMLKASTGPTGLFPSGNPPTVEPNLNLVTTILAQEPPIDQSPNDTVLPVIYVSYSKNFIRRMDYTGRDTIDAAGARTYYLEFYNVIIVREITKEASMKRCQEISQIVRDVYQKNLRMVEPSGTNFVATTNEVIAVPFVLRTENNTIQAINVICRPQLQVSLR